MSQSIQTPELRDFRCQGELLTITVKFAPELSKGTSDFLTVTSVFIYLVLLRVVKCLKLRNYTYLGFRVILITCFKLV